VLSSPVPRKILGVIPARFASSPFPGKVSGAKLAPNHAPAMFMSGRPRLANLDSTIIATDDDRVFEVARSSAPASHDASSHLSGTRTRVGEVASGEDAEWCEHQGDEPLIDPAANSTPPFCRWRTIPESSWAP